MQQFIYFIGLNLFSLTLMHSITFVTPSCQFNSILLRLWQINILCLYFLEDISFFFSYFMIHFRRKTTSNHVYFSNFFFFILTNSFPLKNNFRYYNVIWMHLCLVLLHSDNYGSTVRNSDKGNYKRNSEETRIL